MRGIHIWNDTTIPTLTIQKALTTIPRPRNRRGMSTTTGTNTERMHTRKLLQRQSEIRTTLTTRRRKASALPRRTCTTSRCPLWGSRRHSTALPRSMTTRHTLSARRQDNSRHRTMLPMQRMACRDTITMQ